LFVSYIPMLYTAFLVLIASVVVGHIVIRRFVLVPLARLSQTAVKSGLYADDANELYGLDREDEIGDLARNISHAQESLKHRQKLLDTVNRAAEALLISSEEETDQALKHSMGLIGKCLDVHSIQLWYNDEKDEKPNFFLAYEWTSDDKYKTKHWHNDEIATGSADSQVWFDLIMNTTSINSPFSALNPEIVGLFDKDLKSVALLPVAPEKKLFGFLQIDDFAKERTFSDDEMDIISSAALMFASVLNRNLQKELSLTDALTNTKNRRYLEEEVKKDFKLCQAQNTAFSVIIYDIDNFKKINDKYGHDVGDEVLRIITARSRAVLKQDTELVRYGGEEFVVALAGIPCEDALGIAHRLQDAISKTPFIIGEHELKITASFGVADRCADCFTLEDVISKADKALYTAKRNGRNAVVGQND